jgi:hypothetical protein
LREIEAVGDEDGNAAGGDCRFFRLKGRLGEHFVLFAMVGTSSLSWGGNSDVNCHGLQSEPFQKQLYLCQFEMNISKSFDGVCDDKLVVAMTQFKRQSSDHMIKFRG